MQGGQPYAYDEHQRDERDLKGSGELRHLPLLRHLWIKVERRKMRWTALSGQTALSRLVEVPIDGP
jgi:hypothetical protein